MGVSEYYKREDVQEAILECAKDREIAVKFGESGFGKRPEILQYKRDVAEFAKEGATSFHGSEELWHNPLQLSAEMRKQELEKLRKGWDLILDIDCPFLEYSQIAGDLLVRALRAKGVKTISVKFSGNHGFHIGVPFEAFPKEIKTTKIIDVKEYFPEGVRVIASYLQNMIKKPLSESILKKEDIDRVMEKTGKDFSELVINNLFDPFRVLAIDSVLISSRHMFRMPYSVNEKSGLASIPINPEKILDFRKETAKLENVKISKFRFLERRDISEEAKNLFDDSIAWSQGVKEREELKERFKGTAKRKREDFEVIEKAIPEALFPPCIKNILNGVEDGRKRSLFVLTNFLTSTGWDYDKILELLKKWNAKNKEPLREAIIIGHINYHKQKKQVIPPPNCRSYYEDFQVCKPDNLCEKIKNPVSYAKRKGWGMNKK